MFFWVLLEAIHMYRILSEVRDVNHGKMKVYYAFGYGGPAVIVSLAAGVRSRQFGTVFL